MPAGVEGSVSTVPGSFKEFIRTGDQEKLIRENSGAASSTSRHISERTGKRNCISDSNRNRLCLLENSAGTVSFFEQLRAEHKNDPRLDEFLGVNYDCCHFAVEFEEPQNAMAALRQAGIKISKIHLSSALKTRPTPEARAALAKFADDVYLHQVIARDAAGRLEFYPRPA